MGFCCSGLGWGTGMPWGGAWGGLGILGPIFGLVLSAGLLGVLGLGTVWLVRQLGHQPTAPSERGDPLEIARRRLAAGEITLAEFEEIRGRLQR